MTLWCNDPFGKGCEWSGDEDELVDGGCPGCGGTDFHAEPEDEHDGYDVGGEG